MKDWMMKFFETLAGKLTAILAFAVLLIALLALWGSRIPPDYEALVYIVAILAMVIFAAQVITRRRKQLSLSADGKISTAGNVTDSVQVIGHRNQITNIINNYASKRAGVDREDLQRQVNEYLDWMQESYGTITLRGIERGGSQVVTLPLDSVYVPLQAERKISYEDEMRADLTGKPETRRLEQQAKQREEVRLDEVLTLGNRIIITGGPGSGKTTVLQYIAWSLAAALQGKINLSNQKLGLGEQIPLPVYVPLSLYAAHLRKLPPSAPAEQKSLAYYISEYLVQRQTNLSLPPEFLAHLLRNETCILLLLDGLNEVPNEEERRGSDRRSKTSSVDARTCAWWSPAGRRLTAARLCRYAAFSTFACCR